MKKFYIVLVFGFLSLFVGRGFAQSFNSGLIAGATFCQVDGDSYAGYHQLGFTAGAYANFPLGDFFSAQLELKYSLLGAHSSTKEVMEYNYNPYSLRLHYAEIPIMLRYNFGTFRIGGRPLDFITVEAGVSFDVRLKATEDVDADYQVTTNRWNFFSMTGNAGVHFAFTEHWGFGARWLYSLIPCRYKADSTSFFYGHYHNKVWQFVVTYNINSPLR